MGGFAGFSGDRLSGEERIRAVMKMTERIACRGGGGSGTYTDETVTLGAVGEKTQDEAGDGNCKNQPTVSADGRYVACFDGEILNNRELRAEIKREKSINFRAKSDAELLIWAYKAYGDRVLERLRGTFAFVVYDRSSGEILLARDPFGCKPLYYADFDGAFTFASEIKSVLSHPQAVKCFNCEVLPYYLQLQYVPTEETAFAGIKRLKPGYLLKYKDGSLTEERYFYPPVFGRYGYKPFAFFAERDGIDRKRLPYKSELSSACKEIRRAVEASVAIRMRRAEENAEAQGKRVGAFLSGGVDSGYLAAISGIKTAFTVGFPSYGFDERALASVNAERFGAELTALEADADDFFDCVAEVQYRSDEPYANLSAIPLYLICKKASERVDAVFSGEGADELFGGYEWYFDSYFGKAYRLLPISLRQRIAKVGILGRSGEFLRRNKGDARADYVGQARIMDESTAFSLLKKPYAVQKSPTELTAEHYLAVKGASLLRSKMYLDLNLWLPGDILLKADRMSAAFAIKLYAPYLDLEVLRVSEGLADRLLVRKKIGKYAFRVTAAEKLGREAAFRKKKGFPVPLREWLRERKYAKIFEIAFTGAIGRQFFDTERLLSLLDAHVSGTENNARILYTVYAFIKWYEVFFGEDMDGEAVRGGFAVVKDKLMHDTVPSPEERKEEKADEELQSGHSWL